MGITDIDKGVRGRGNWPRAKNVVVRWPAASPLALLFRAVEVPRPTAPAPAVDHQLARHQRPLHRHVSTSKPSPAPEASALR